MGMMTSAFANSSFSLLVGKIQGTIVDYLQPPLSTGELLAGLVASVDHIADLDDRASGSRRDRVLTSMSSLRSLHDELTTYLVSELRLLPGVTVLGEPARRIPTVAFLFAGRTAQEVAERVADQGVCVLIDPGDQGALEVIGGAEIGGVVKVGLAHYSTRSDVDALVRALGAL